MGTMHKWDMIREYRFAERCGDREYAREIAFAFDCVCGESIYNYV